jgi:nitrogen regulatory protein PII
MSYMVVLIVNDTQDLSIILDEWEKAGTTGITILESTGIGRIRQAGLRDDIPLMPSLDDLFDHDETHHRTIFSVVPDQADVDKLVAISREVLGDFDAPHSGFLFVLPVLQAYGLGVKKT